MSYPFSIFLYFFAKSINSLYAKVASGPLGSTIIVESFFEVLLVLVFLALRYVLVLLFQVSIVLYYLGGRYTAPHDGWIVFKL